MMHLYYTNCTPFGQVGTYVRICLKGGFYSFEKILERMGKVVSSLVASNRRYRASNRVARYQTIVRECFSVKKKSLFDLHLEETYCISEMLKQQGKTDAERKAYQHIATILIFIEDNLRLLCTLVALLLGFQIGKLISGLL